MPAETLLLLRAQGSTSRATPRHGLHGWIEALCLARAALGKPLRPSVVVPLAAIPKTRNGKVMRRLVRAAWLGLPLGDLTALEDPGALDEIAHAAKMKIQ